MTNPEAPVIHVVAVAFQKFGPLKVFVQSWLNQTRDNWILTLIHDGPSDEFDSIMEQYARQAPDRIVYYCTANRFNDYGHSLRDMELRDARGDYVLLTNADNYFIPKAIEFINEVLVDHDPDVVMFDMVHSHDRPGGRNIPAYSYFETRYEPGGIDVSAAIVRAALAQKAGFRDKTHDGDASYFEDLVKAKFPSTIAMVRIPRVLFVHN
jgi:glycosyltransferase involved in cell wall biosynthesis